MNKRKLTVKVSSLEESLAKFKSVWNKKEKGEKISTPVEIISFQNASTLMKVLSPKRLELLQTLHMLGMASIRKLAKELERDYSNVHQDVKALSSIGIILNKEGKYCVPWESISTEIPLCIEKSSKHRHYCNNEMTLRHTK